MRVAARTRAATRGMLTLGSLSFPCALGRGGCRLLKREGDGATPLGCWTLSRILYRADRLLRPRTLLPVAALKPGAGWCDAPGDRNYNRPVGLPYPGRAERLWRQDGLYDVLVVLGYNHRPRLWGRGSAVFLHVAREGLAPTEGCIALKATHLLRLLVAIKRSAKLSVAWRCGHRG